MRSLFSNKKVAAALVAPGIAIIAFAIIVPIGFSIYFSLTDWTGLGSHNIVGFENYREILTNDPVFWRSLLNVLLLMFVTIFIQNPVAFALAALLSHLTERFSRVLRTIYFVPAALSVVIIARLWVNIFNPTYGILNKVFKVLGLDFLATSWLSNPKSAIWAVIWIVIWQGFGWALLFYYTGLMSVPKEIEEAARVDGANWFQTYVKVIIPYLFPVIASVLVIDVISCMKQMEIIFLSTEGGPGQLTQFIAVYLYQKAFSSGQYGYGNALSVLFIAVAVGLTFLVRRLLSTERKGGAL